MTNLLQPNLELLNTDPEVKSYIYQQISEFEPFITPETVVAVIAKDPKRLATQLAEEGKDLTKAQLAQMYRISIILKEGEAQIQEEALDRDVFTAIRLAKEKLLVKLNAIQDQVISNQERAAQINTALANGGTLH